MRTLSASDAKSHFSELLADVERGETVELTRHGKPVVRMMPISPHGVEDAARAIAELRRLRDTLPKAGITLEEILEMRHEGHRY